ncbi:MAG TPA: hypothetical protein ENJ19_00640 [Gammaproteobacteria bacterium]|nr:hypothetical protein [Gammaproteobacteria bacterium]
MSRHSAGLLCLLTLAGLPDLNSDSAAAGIATAAQHSAGEPVQATAAAAGENGVAPEQQEGVDKTPVLSAITLRIQPLGGMPDSKTRPARLSFIITVEGYGDHAYVYGELSPVSESDLEGYLYTQDGARVYLYGHKERGGIINAYDKAGHHYLLSPWQAKAR